MKKITVDMSPVINGSRAIKRCTECMVNELIGFEDMALDLLYFDYKFQSEKYLRPTPDHVKETVIPIPYKLLIPFWKKYCFPYLETFFCKSDCFYTNEFYFPPSKNAITLATIHGLAYKVIPDKLPAQNVQSLNQGLQYILSHSDYLIAVSETTKKELTQCAEVDPERIYVVTHGVDKQFRQLENQQEVWNRLKINYGLNNPYILYVGAIGVHKNVMGILSAYETISHELPQHLVLVGPQDSAWDRASRFVVEKNLTPKVHFLGHVFDTNKLVDLYNGADLFVFPSFYEGWTSPPLEAMACGTPVITSNCSSLLETVGDAAIHIDPEAIEELVDEIGNILSDHTLKKNLIQNGLDHVARHTWKIAAEKLVAVFADVQSRGPWNK
jgi:glycosyltransferase involved in cell wall biosynthesis